MQERQYYREIRKLYRLWLNDWLPQIGRAIGRKLDAASDWLGPLFEKMAADFAVRVKRFAVAIKKRANNISSLATLEPSEDTTINMTAAPWETDARILEDIEDFSSENADLITNIGNQTARRIKTVVVDALKEGVSTTTLKKQIAKIDKAFGQNRARLIARDQIGKLQSQITRTRAQRADKKKYEWMSMMDGRERKEHHNLDGEIRTWDQSPRPGEPIACRCVAIVI